MTRTAPEFDVAIVGAGVIGCAIAHHLGRHDVRVGLIDKETDVGFGTSKANSGIIHAGHHSPSGTVKGPLEWSGNQQWGPLAAELGISFQRVGDLTVAFEPDELDTLDTLLQQGREREVPGVELWDADRLRREEPNLNPDALGALHAPTTGVVNPYEACFALAEDAADNGVALMLDAPVGQIAAVDGGFELTTRDRRVRARYVVNAAGLGADHIAAMVGLDSFRLIGRKGEEYLLDKRLDGLVQHIIFPCPTPTSKGILVIPTYDGTIMVGPTAVEVEDRDDLTTTADGAGLVFASVQRLVPGISPGDCIAEFAGVRAVADTGDFVIGPTEVPGFVNVAGIQSPGLTAAPAIAELVADVLRAEGLDLNPEHEVVAPTPRPTPVRDIDTERRAARAEDDPTFARIICRCELVTEREVADSIEHGASTLDGVKFRTRAGMGRCQGGFCTWRVMQLLAAGLDVPMSEVTKKGDGSWIVVDRTEGEDPMDVMP